MLGLSILKSKVVIIKNNNVKTLSVLNKGAKRISKTYACEHILHCSPATFDNYVRAGIIPKGKKEIGFNELSWSLKDFDGVRLQRIHKK